MIGFGDLTEQFGKWWNLANTLEWHLGAMDLVMKEIKPHAKTTFKLNHPTHGEPQEYYVAVPLPLYKEMEALHRKSKRRYRQIVSGHETKC